MSTGKRGQQINYRVDLLYVAVCPAFYGLVREWRTDMYEGRILCYEQKTG